MQVTYIGDPRADGHGPKTQEIHGITFVKNEVQDLDDKIADRFKGHSHFVVGESAEVPETDERGRYDDMLVADLRAVADKRGLKHDGMGKAELRELLREADKAT